MLFITLEYATPKLSFVQLPPAFLPCQQQMSISCHATNYYHMAAKVLYQILAQYDSPRAQTSYYTNIWYMAHAALISKSNKKNIKKNERTYRDGIPKKQSNKVGMVPQYPYRLSSLYLLPFLQLVPSKAKLYSSSIDLFSS